MHEAEGENDYEDDQTVTTHDPGGLAHGLQSASPLGGITSTGGASVLPASRDTGGGVWDSSEDPTASPPVIASTNCFSDLPAPRDVPFSQRIPMFPVP